MSFVVGIEHNIILATAMADGLSASKIAKLMDIAPQCLKKHFGESLEGYTFKRKRKQQKEPYVKGTNMDKSRDADICERYLNGETLVKIGDSYSVTRERIRQILKRCDITGKDGGCSIAAGRNAIVRKNNKIKESDRLKKNFFGCSKKVWDYYRSLDDDYKKTPLGFYSMQKKNAAQRGIKWDLTINEWWFIWSNSGKWEERGRTKNSYVMSRVADKGGYSIDNVHIVTQGENSAEYYMLYKEEWIEKMIKAHPDKCFSKTK